MGQHRRNYTDEYTAAAVERLYEPGATQGSVAKELGITGGFVAQIGLRLSFPFPRMDLAYGHDTRYMVCQEL